jgi:hypothetical protein
MARRLLTLLLALVLTAPVVGAQDDGLPPPPGPRPGGTPEPEPEPEPEPQPPAPDKPPPPPVAPAPAGQHRVRFKREQGAADALKAQLERTLAALKATDTAAAGEALRAFAPNDEALQDAFTDEGYKALAPKIREGAAQLFAGEPAEIARRLGLRPELEEVEVFTATTEDLLTMESGTDAAREFASGLRRTAQHLEPRYVWYCAVIKPKAPAEDAPPAAAPAAPVQPARLQLFFFHQGKFVLLGRVWRIEDE